MRTRALLLLLSLLLAAAPDASAQHRQGPRVPTGLYVGGQAVYARPSGEFADFVDRGFGLAGHLLYAPRGSLLGLRLDGGFVSYGRERTTVPLSPTLGGRIRVDLTTSNNIVFFGAGPQIGTPDGRFRPYANAFAGVSYLFTESSLEGVDDQLDFARTTNYDDVTFGYGAGAGIYVPLRGGASPISVDLGVRYHNNGEADYLREGDIRDNPDGSITLTPVRSDTDLFTVQLGLSMGVGRGGDGGDRPRPRGCRRRCR